MGGVTSRGEPGIRADLDYDARVGEKVEIPVGMFRCSACRLHDYVMGQIS